jgi:hypothetical protein
MNGGPILYVTWVGFGTGRHIDGTASKFASVQLQLAMYIFLEFLSEEEQRKNERN